MFVSRSRPDKTACDLGVKFFLCRANVAHVRQSRPDFSLDFMAEVLEVVSSRSFFAEKRRERCGARENV